MIVKQDLRTPSFLLLLFAILVFPDSALCLAKCDRGMLNNYGLAGRTYSTSYPMKVCGHILDNCCALSDDVKIVGLWNAHTRPIMQRHTSYCINNLEAIISYFFPLAELDPQLIVVKQVSLRRTPYQQHQCVQVTRRMTPAQRNHFFQYADRRVRNRAQLFDRGQRHWGVFSNMTTTNQQRPFIQMKRNRNRQYFMKVNRKRLERLQQRRTSLRTGRPGRPGRTGRKLLDSGSDQTDLDARRADALIALNELAIKRAGDKMTKESVKSFVDERGHKITSREANLVANSLAVKGVLKGMTPEGRLLADNLGQAAKAPVAAPQGERKLTDSKPSHKAGKAKTPKKAVKKAQTTAKSPRKLQGATMPLRAADSFLAIPQPQLTTLRCTRRRASYFRDYIVVNPRKVRFCYGLYQDFMHYNMEYFNATLVDVKKNMMVLGDLRKQFFCSLCDGHAQKFFDHKKQVMIYKNDFCSNLISEFLDYLQFLNVMFIEFADSLLQYVQCFETDGNIYNFPFQNFLVKYKRRIHFYKKCFESVTGQDPSYMKNCWFICNKWSFLKMNGVFDGDLPLLTRIRIALFSFLRKLSQQSKIDREQELKESTPRNVSRIDLGIIENVNGILIEPVAPGLLLSNRRYYMGAVDRTQVLGNFSVTGVAQLPPQILPQVNNFLSSMNLRSVDELVMNFRRGFEQMSNRTVGEARRTAPFDETLHQKSRVNGMVNQLWNLQTKQRIADWMMPPRRLKQEAVKIIKEAGFNPVSRERRLQQFELFPNIRLPSQQASPANNTVNHPRVRNVDGKRIKIKNPELVISEHDKRFVTEIPNEIFEKIDETIDLYNYGTTFSEDGLNPLAYFYFADFERNVTNIINEHFEKPEKLDSEVLIDYLGYTSRKINEFNEIFDQEVEEFAEIKNRDKKYNRLKSVHNYATINDRFKLGKVAEGRIKEVIVHTKEDEAKRRRDQQRIKLMKKYEQAKALDALKGPDLSQHLMTNMPNFHDTFHGMSHFFANLFGP